MMYLIQHDAVAQLSAHKRQLPVIFGERMQGCAPAGCCVRCTGPGMLPRDENGNLRPHGSLGLKGFSVSGGWVTGLLLKNCTPVDDACGWFSWGNQCLLTYSTCLYSQTTPPELPLLIYSLCLWGSPKLRLTCSSLLTPPSNKSS